MAKSQTPAPAPEEALVTQNQAVAAFDPAMFLEDEAQSFSSNELTIPMIKIVQKGSPQLERQHEKWIRGAQVGMFFNTLTGQLWPGYADPENGVTPEMAGIIAVPVLYTMSYTEWVPNMGGFVHDYGADDSIMASIVGEGPKGEQLLANGNEVVDAALYFLLIVDRETGTTQWDTLTMKSTQVKKSRAWNSIYSMTRIPGPNGPQRPAWFYHSYQLTTVFEKHKTLPHDWYGFKVTPHKRTVDLPNGPAIYQEARDFKKMIMEGRAKADIQSERDAIKSEPAF